MDQHVKQSKATAAPATENGKRDKSRGEILFDLVVYGGIGWVANALLSVFVTHKLTHGNWKGFGDSFTGGIKTGLTGAGKVLPLPGLKNDVSLTKASGSIFMVSALFIGGSLLVIPMRGLEAIKGKLVRAADKFLSRDVDANVIQQQHEAMDSAPQQSWKSLIEGRVAALGLALVLNPLIGDWSAQSTKLLKNTPVKDFSSMERASVNLTNAVARGFKPDTKNVMFGQPLGEQVNPGIIKSSMLTLDLMISSITAVFFYFSTRMFAKGIAKKVETNEQHSGRSSSFLETVETPSMHAEKPAKETPTPKISHITREAHLANVAHVNQLSAG